MCGQRTRLKPEELKAGYDWAYREFYRWSSISRAALAHRSRKHQAKHFFYAAGWKKFEAAWNMVIRARQLAHMTPMLEAVLSRVTAERYAPATSTPTTDSAPPMPPMPQRSARGASG